MGSEMCIRDRYRKGRTAVEDRCVYISYNRYRSVPKSVICCCSGRDSCMLTSRCMLPWLRSAPYPALCPCEPLCPVGDMQAVSYGARSRQYSPLLPGSRPPARNFDLSLSDHAQGPCVGFIVYIYNYPGYLKTAQACLKTASVDSLPRPCLIINARCRAWLDQL